MAELDRQEQDTLSLRLSTDGFSLAAYSSDGGDGMIFRNFHVTLRHSMAANVKEFLAQAEELGRTYREVNIIVHTPRYTPVPFELYEDDRTEMLFYQNLPQRNNEIILCNILGKSNVAVLFAIDKLTHQLLSDRFPNARFFASISPVIEYLTVRTRNRECESGMMFVISRPGDIDVLAFMHQGLTLVNTYQTTGMDDKNYYLLNAWKQLGMDQEKDILYMTGGPFLAEQTDFLKKYLRNIFMLDLKDEFHGKPAGRLSEVPFDILSLILCE